MRTLPLVLVVVLVNDAVLLLALDVAVPAMLVVGGAALGLTGLFAVVVGAAVDEDGPPSRADLDEQFRAIRADLTRLEKRVDELED